jgi:hypothetical protein
MAAVQYESKENAGHKYWTGRYCRCAVRIEANRAWRLPVADQYRAPGAPQ